MLCSSTLPFLGLLAWPARSRVFPATRQDHRGAPGVSRHGFVPSADPSTISTATRYPFGVAASPVIRTLPPLRARATSRTGSSSQRPTDQTHDPAGSGCGPASLAPPDPVCSCPDHVYPL